MRRCRTYADDPRCPETGKIMFTSQVQAERRAARVAMRGRLKKSETAHAYECPHCGGWHIGRDKSRDGRFSQHLSERDDG